MPVNSSARPARDTILPYAALAVAWAAAVLLTHPVTTGDTADYIASITARLHGGDYNYWEFGHLFWRPAGTYLARLMGGLLGTADPRVTTLGPLVAVNVLAGGGAGIFLAGTLRRLGVSVTLAAALALAFLLTQGVLDYAQTGTSYVPGLFFLTAGLYFAVRGATQDRWLRSCLVAGLCGALAAAFWFPYVFVIPALGLAAGVLGPQRRIGPVLAVAAGAASAGIVIFVGTAIALGARTPSEFWAMLTAATHGITGISGVPRALLGFGRSFLYIGDDGAIMRRYLEGDPYAPVSLPRLLVTRIWLIGIIWGVGLFLLLRLVRRREHRPLLAVFTIAAVPIMIWAIAWQGGDIERYMPLYPFVFLLFARILEGNGAGRIRWVVAVGLVFMSVNNLVGLSRFAAEAKRGAVAYRLESVRGVASVDDLLWVSHIQDDVLRVANAFPLQPLVDGVDVQTGYLVQFGAPQVDEWRELFARRVQRFWNRGSNVWISSRLLAPIPEVHWNWIEGSDPRVQWSDFAAFFGGFDFGPGEGDTFLLLLRTPANEARIDRLAAGRAVSRVDGPVVARAQNRRNPGETKLGS